MTIYYNLIYQPNTHDLPFADITSMCIYPFKSFSTFITDGTIFSGVPRLEKNNIYRIFLTIS